MRSSLVLLATILLIASGAVAQAADISGSLLAEMDRLAAGESIEALVTFNHQADIYSLDLALKQRKATLAERNRAVIEALQDAATFTQPEIAAFLENLKSQGLVNDYKMFWVTNMFWVDIQRAGIDVLAAHPSLSSLTLNYPIENHPLVKSEPSDNLITNVEIGLERINAPAAWAQGWTGAGRVVMNIDTGVDGTHPALSERFRGDVDEDGDFDESWLDPYDTNWPDPHDGGSHGTHTMGTICGRTASGDTIGVAIDAQWIAAAAVDRGGGIDRTIQDILISFEWAVDPDGDRETQDNPDAIGNSWGIPDSWGEDCDETFWQVIDNVEAAGSVVVFSAGNEGSSGLRSPADRATTYYNCFSVGAVDGNSDNLPPASFTARGPTECASGDLAIKPEVTAPGVNVRSSVPGGGYSYYSGTSMSSPHVTGSVAIIRQVNPDLDVDTIKEILMTTAHDLPFSNPDGEDNIYGHGIIDVFEACLIAQSGYGFVHGEVTDSEGAGIGGALIEVIGAPRLTYADDTGHYEIGLPADTSYNLRASFFGYIPEEGEATVFAEDTTYLDFTLQMAPSGSLHGTVINIDDSSPIEGANVLVVGAPIDPVQTDQDGYYVFESLPGDQTHMIEVAASGFGLGEGEVFIPEGGEAELDFALAPFESFESDDAGWVGEGVWEWGQPTSGPGGAFDGNNVWATVLGGQYANNVDDGLVTTAFLLEESNATLSFYHWYDIEQGSQGWDGGNVSISVDGGANWEIIHPDGDYPDDSIVGLDGDPGFTGSSEWALATFEIGQYVDNVVSFRYRFGTDGSITYDGWYLDAFVVTGASPVEGGGDPVITYQPASYRVELEQGNSTERTLTIGNVGEGILYYSIAPITIDRRLRDSDPDDSIDPFRLDPEWGKYLTYERNGEMLTVTYDGPKNETSDNESNPPVIADYGGPDEFGYTWIDSDEPNGPEFDWIDITGIGEPLMFDDDENQGPFPLGFDMPFYDNFFGSINICSNGWISFTSTSTDYSNDPIPGSTEPNNLVAPFWDDLDPSDGGMIYFYTNNVDTAIVAWVNVPHYEFTGPGLYTFEAIMLADGDIVFQYASVEGELLSNTVGIENDNGSVGLEIVYDSPYVTDGLAVRINFPIFWLDIDPRSGYNHPDESSDFTVTFDASELELGEYRGYLRIDSNDPADPSVAVYCTLAVVDPTGIDDAAGGNIPNLFALDQNYPNPFNPSTEISFALPAQSEVELVVFDMLGRQVKTLVNEELQAGYHSVVWNGTDNSGQAVSSGIYFYSVKAGEFNQNRKMILLK